MAGGPSLSAAIETKPRTSFWALGPELKQKERGGFSSRTRLGSVNLDSRKKFYSHWGKKKR